MSVQLSAEQLNDLRQLEDTHTIIRQEIDRAKAAGLDMTEYEQKLNALEQVRVGLLKQYGTPRKRQVVG